MDCIVHGLAKSQTQLKLTFSLTVTTLLIGYTQI